VTLYGANVVCVLLILSNSILLFTESLPLTGETNISPCRIHLQTATASELELLPVIGHAMSERIVIFRLEHEISTLYDLVEIHKIGQKKIDDIRRLVRQEQSEQ